METANRLLWLDDERDPFDARWQTYFPIRDPVIAWVKSVEQFSQWIEANGLPAAICFDHDLGMGPSGLDAAKWLINFCLDHQKQLPFWNIQSANPIGKKNIASLLNTFDRHQKD